VRYDELTPKDPNGHLSAIKKPCNKIRQQAGTGFDPTLTELFCRTMREQPPQH
jgi:response regulator RpfG family c-di-GMP phosphodiesterase